MSSSFILEKFTISEIECLLRSNLRIFNTYCCARLERAYMDSGMNRVDAMRHVEAFGTVRTDTLKVGDVEVTGVDLSFGAVRKPVDPENLVFEEVMAVEDEYFRVRDLVRAGKPVDHFLPRVMGPREWYEREDLMKMGLLDDESEDDEDGVEEHSDYSDNGTDVDEVESDCDEEIESLYESDDGVVDDVVADEIQFGEVVVATEIYSDVVSGSGVDYQGVVSNAFVESLTHAGYTSGEELDNSNSVSGGDSVLVDTVLHTSVEMLRRHLRCDETVMEKILPRNVVREVVGATVLRKVAFSEEYRNFDDGGDVVREVVVAEDAELNVKHGDTISGVSCDVDVNVKGKEVSNDYSRALVLYDKRRRFGDGHVEGYPDLSDVFRVVYTDSGLVREPQDILNRRHLSAIGCGFVLGRTITGVHLNDDGCEVYCEDGHVIYADHISDDNKVEDDAYWSPLSDYKLMFPVSNGEMLVSVLDGINICASDMRVVIAGIESDIASGHLYYDYASNPLIEVLRGDRPLVYFPVANRRVRDRVRLAGDVTALKCLVIEDQIPMEVRLRAFALLRSYAEVVDNLEMSDLDLMLPAHNDLQWFEDNTECVQQCLATKRNGLWRELMVGSELYKKVLVLNYIDETVSFFELDQILRHRDVDVIRGYFLYDEFMDTDQCGYIYNSQFYWYRYDKFIYFSDVSGAMGVVRYVYDEYMKLLQTRSFLFFGEAYHTEAVDVMDGLYYCEIRNYDARLDGSLSRSMPLRYGMRENDHTTEEEIRDDFENDFQHSFDYVYDDFDRNMFPSWEGYDDDDVGLSLNGMWNAKILGAAACAA